MPQVSALRPDLDKPVSREDTKIVIDEAFDVDAEMGRR